MVTLKAAFESSVKRKKKGISRNF